MSIDERSRYALFLRLEETLGSEEASTLMEHLPPVGWADVATKRDLELQLEVLQQSFRAELQQAINGAITTQTRVMVLNQLGTFIAVLGLIAALRAF